MSSETEFTKKHKEENNVVKAKKFKGKHPASGAEKVVPTHDPKLHEKEKPVKKTVAVKKTDTKKSVGKKSYKGGAI
jgi:hypothetical protein